MSIVIDRTEVTTDKSPLILWDNLYGQGALAASSQTIDGPKENAVDNNTYDYWTPSAMPAALSTTLGAAKPASYLGVAAHNMGTKGNTISVEYKSGTSWIELASVTPTDDSTLIIAFTETSATEFRIYISGGTAPSIGVVSLGVPIRFDSGILPSYTPLYMAEQIELMTSQTLGGQFITNRVNRKGARSQFALNILERSFVEGDAFQKFRRHYNGGKTFFFASNPSELKDDAAYCWRQDGGEISPRFDDNGIFYRTQLSLEAYIGN